MFFFYQLAVLLLLLVFLCIVLLNLRDFRELPSRRQPTGAPKVSVLVPARNEERNIVACITSLLHQDYGDYEIIVLDDGSTDATGELLRDLCRTIPGNRLKVVGGKPLPAGWHGKAWACQQLGEEAGGRYLLFTDADTLHSPSSIASAVAALEESGADMLSLTPYQELGSFWEKAVVPLVYVILLNYLPLRLVPAHPSPALCFANGQFIMFRRESYLGINGHAAVRSQIVEDVGLCRSVKRRGGKVVAYNGCSTVQCRMYRTGWEVWEGFSKNLFPGLGYSTPLLVFLLGLTVVLNIIPYAFLIVSAASQSFTPVGFWLPLLQVIMALAGRQLIAIRFRQPVATVALHLLSQVALLCIATNSWLQVKYGGGSNWKGRRYDFSGSAAEVRRG